MAKSYGYIIIYNNNGDIVYQHKGSNGDYCGTVSLSNNIVTILIRRLQNILRKNVTIRSKIQ